MRFYSRMSLCCLVCYTFILATTFTINGKDLRIGELKPARIESMAAGVPNTQNCSHRVGNVYLTITNWGFYGSSFEDAYGGWLTEDDCLGPGVVPGEFAPSFEFPGGSNINYLFKGALWIGAIIGSDTVVSVGEDGWQLANEMYPEPFPGGVLLKRSTRTSDPDYDPEAISDPDFIAVYFDTLTDPSYTDPDFMDHRPHYPLGLRIVQESYSWSEQEYEDFVILRYTITNIGNHFLQDVFVGIYIDADVWDGAHNVIGFTEDVSGSLTISSVEGNVDRLIAWAADNDGDPEGGNWGYWSPRGIMGVAFLDYPVTPDQNFNWWVSHGDNDNLDWGPRQQVNNRDFGTGGLGTPEGDRNKYYVLRTSERDYDQFWSHVDMTSDGWLPPNTVIGYDLADGYDTRFLLSFGSVDLASGDSTEFAFVIAAGDNFHRNPTDFQTLFNANDPQPFYNSLDFSDLITNIQTANCLYRRLKDNLYGDINNSCWVNITDLVYLIRYLYSGGSAPENLNYADVNGDCAISLTDAVYLVDYIFQSGAAPVAGCVQ